MKKPYEKPAIAHTAAIESRAVTCAKANDSCAALGPIDS